MDINTTEKKLEYTINFPISDLIAGIVEKLERELKDTSVEERVRLAEVAIETMLPQGNYAVYQALLNYCVGIAIRQYETANGKK